MLVDYFGHDPDWNLFAKGAMLFAIGVLTVAAVIYTGGSCLPLVAASYAALATAGVITATMGAYEMGEAFTGENKLKETVGESFYENAKMASLTVISMGSAIISYGTSISVCFVAGTMIKTDEGNIPIEEIQIGDEVFAHNPQTGETELKSVVNTFVNEASELIHIIYENEEIICTKEHPFYSPAKGWVSASKLRAGDILVTLNGRYVVLEQVQHEILETPVKVYNFEVEDFHTYFVGNDDAVLVHNKCDRYQPPAGGGGPTASILKGNKTITFCHGGRHIEKIHLSMNQVNQIIANDVINRNVSVGYFDKILINIDGIDIQYHYYVRSEDLINIGTYYDIPK